MTDTTIILTPVDAERFKKFQEHYHMFELMDKYGVFDVQYGKVVFNIANGGIQNIVKEEQVYNSKYTVA